MQNYTILVVDDEPNIVSTLAFELKKEGYAVVPAADGRQAFELAKAAPPDLIIADVMMPVMDGYELCRRVKETPALRHIPFIFLTAKTGKDNQVYGFALGAQKYLGKPVKRDQLLKVVNLRLRLAADAKKLYAKKARQFDGNLSIISVFSLLDMYYIGGWSGAIELKRPDGRAGRIELKDAEIVRCTIGGDEYDGAFTQLLAWDSGTFSATHE
ncbi:MAG TPA: response regulator [Candidatus Edwardsbacteria bacterium]|nr:response regulator [Candidatus Edwardsbacteria bacterium]